LLHRDYNVAQPQIRISKKIDIFSLYDDLSSIKVLYTGAKQFFSLVKRWNNEDNHPRQHTPTATEHQTIPTITCKLIVNHHHLQSTSNKCLFQFINV